MYRTIFPENIRLLERKRLWFVCALLHVNYACLHTYSYSATYNFDNLLFFSINPSEWPLRVNLGLQSKVRHVKVLNSQIP